MEQRVFVPDIGDIDEVEVIEILVNSGDTIEIEQSLISLESDKATMEVPAPIAGTVNALAVKIGDKVKQGSEILTLDSKDSESSTQPDSVTESDTPADSVSTSEQNDEIEDSSGQSGSESAGTESRPEKLPQTQAIQTKYESGTHSAAHASPSVRRFARELGADLGRIIGSGRKGRILKEDVKAFIKVSLGKPLLPGASSLTRVPSAPVDFSKYGQIESVSLSRIQRLSAAHLHDCWVSIPHVTQQGQADITDLEEFRKSLKPELDPLGVKLTLLPFLMKAAVATLQSFPRFNASLQTDGETLVMKKYYHVGVAVDTPEGLVVPVVRDVDKKGLSELASELAELGARARDKKLKPTDLQGGCFTISSLGGIGGTAFTPIINKPEVAILGVSRSSIQAVYLNKEFVPRLMLPLSLSYDHRVIDGAAAARFIVFLGSILEDMRRTLI